MELKISHTTRYSYDQPAVYALQRLRLRPCDGPMQTVQDWDVTVDGGQIELGYEDHHGNLVDLASTNRGAVELTVTASGTVQTNDTSGVLGHVFGRAPLWHFLTPTAQTQPNGAIRKLAKLVRNTEDPIDDLHALSAAILDAVPYETGRTGSATTAAEALSGGHGVCQDHANLMISAARVAGLPARYVSGYLMMNETVNQEASHAWAEIYTKTIGWVGFDVSNGYSPDGRYVRLAIGVDAHDTNPITGMRIGAGDESLIVNLQVQQ